MKKITLWIKKNYLLLLPLIPITIYIISLWNTNYDTYGDTSVPLNPINNIEKSLYLWEVLNHGVNGWRYMYLLWQLPFYGISSLGFPPYVSIKIYIASIMIIGFIFAYLFFVTLFKNKKYNNKKYGILFSFIFVLSAGSVDILPSTIFLSALPLCGYLLIKHLDTDKIRYGIFFSLAINYSYLAHLPQAKYLFVLLGELFFVLLLYLQIREVSFKTFFFKLVRLIIITIFLNAFVLMPFLYDAFRSGGTYSFLTQNVTVYNGDAELHTATLPYVTRLFTSSLASGNGSLARFLGSFVFSIWTFIILILGFCSIFLVKTRKERNIIYTCLLGFTLFMFLAKGSNPPFGEIYKFLLFNIPLFKVFRTTSMSVIGATTFIATMVTISIFYLSRSLKKLLIYVVIIHLFVFAPIYFGVRQVTFEDKDQIKKGFSIPREYYQMGNILDAIKDDTKVLSLPLDDSYTYKDWPYIGQSIMGWIMKKPYIHGQVAGYPGFVDNLILQRMNKDESCYWTAINNVGYILKEKDSNISDYTLSKFNFSGKKALDNSIFTLEKVKSDCVLPHVYVATDAILFSGENNSIPDAVRFIKNKKDSIIPLEHPVNKQKDFKHVKQFLAEVRPNELKELSDNPITQKWVSDLSYLEPLTDWTYSFSVPKKGIYELVIDSNGDIHKELKFLEKGSNTIKVPIVKEDNLISHDALRAFQDKKTPSFLQEIQNWSGDGIYLLSLRYKSKTASNIIIDVKEKERHYRGRLPSYDINAPLLSQELTHDIGTYTYQAILKAYINAQSATVTIEERSGSIAIDSFMIEKVSPPKVFINLLNGEEKTSPAITFNKLNPTKYTVSVGNVKDPYNLIFSESFNSDWKVYIATCTTTCNPLQSFTTKSIPEERHYLVNGFANGWYILPSDNINNANYSIIIEYLPQRLFYLGGIISLITLIILLVYSKIKNKI